MTAISSDLPSFDHPPVIETVLGVFFRPLRKLNSVEQGIFWNEVLRTDFPDFELRPPVEEVVERFESDSAVFQAGVRWQVSSEPDTPRLWAKSRTGEHIVQVQRNAILVNWLRRTEYRPFHERLADFERRLSQFDEFAHRAQFDQVLSPTSCTITYINHIPVDSSQSWAAVVARVLTCWSNPPTDWLPAVDRGRLQFSFAFPSESGRLHVAVTPAQLQESAQLVVQLELTARLMLPKEQQLLTHVPGGLQTAHDWVVRGFTALTQPEMHQAWGRTR